VSSNRAMSEARQVVRRGAAHQILRVIFFGCIFALLLADAVSLQAQSFTLTPTTLSPAAVDPGGISIAQVSVGGGASVGSVSFTCTVSSNNSGVSASEYPTCLISPSSVVPNAILSLTVTAGNDTPAGEYSVVVTGTAGSGPPESTDPIYLNVVDVQQDYTLTVTKTISPGTVSPGGGAQATVTVTPIASYTGTVTLSCLSVTPTQVGAPYCSFNPPSVDVTSSSGGQSVLTISTYGTQQTVSELEFPRIFRGFWLALPGLALMGASFGGARRKRSLGLFLLLVVAGGFLLLPSCGGPTVTSNNNIGYVTPKDTYTFTLTGVDQNGVAPGNSTTDQATVILTVN
jgi:hypothetical protein